MKLSLWRRLYNTRVLWCPKRKSYKTWAYIATTFDWCQFYVALFYWKIRIKYQELIKKRS